MKKTTPTLEEKISFDPFFDEFNYSDGKITTFDDADKFENSGAKESVNTSLLPENLFGLMKFVFIYLPGSATLYLAGTSWIMLPYLDGFYGEFILNLLGFLSIGSFLTLFGIGKLRDLKYLKVVAAILLVSIPAGLLFWLPKFVDFENIFGFLLLAFWFLSAIAGWFTKKNLDYVD